MRLAGRRDAAGDAAAGGGGGHQEAGGDVYCARPDFSPPAWLERLTGEAFFKDVDQVALAGSGVTDAGLENLQGFNRLRVLWLNGAKVTDAGLAKLGGFGELEELCSTASRSPTPACTTSAA